MNDALQAGTKAAGYASDVAREMASRTGVLEAPSPPSGSFFDKTENNYQQMESRARNMNERLDNFCDQIGGVQALEAGRVTADGQDRHPAAFDRCNYAESNMYGAFNLLEEAIVRLENLGLT